MTNRASHLTLTVAPDGDDRGRGPLATLRGARDAIRATRAAGVRGPVTVLIRGGWYFLEEPFVLEPRDSGTADAPVVYRAAPGEQPIFSGGVRLSGFRETTIHGQPGWVADVPAGLAFTQLFVNGQRMRRTRLPRTGYYRIAESVAEPSKLDLDWESRVRQFRCRPGEFDAGWHRLQDVAVVVLNRWFESHARVAAYDPQTQLVTLDAHLLGGDADSDGRLVRYWIENVFEALTEPGQFYFDRAAGQLWYRPRFGDRLATAQVIAPRLTTLVELAGDPWGEPVRHIRFEQLEFRHTDYRYPVGEPGGVQAAFSLPGAITLRGATDCVFENCTVAQVAQYGIEFRLGCTRNRVVGCHLHDLGGGGVKINHDHGDRTPVHEDVIRLPAAPAAGVHVPADKDPRNLPRQAVTVSDCRIHDGGKIFPSAVGVWVGDSSGNRICHNEIWNFHYSGISCGWTWVYEFNVQCADNLIAGNHIHHLGQERLLSDLAGIYTLGPNPGTVLRGNLIHDVASDVYGDWGIYHDGSSAFILDEGNAAFRCGYGGWFSNAGRQNYVRRNVLLNTASPDNPAMCVGDDNATLTVTAEENIFVSAAPQVLLPAGFQGHVRFRGNWYANELGAIGAATRLDAHPVWSLAECEKRGWAAGERVLPHTITGLDTGALRLPPDSPLWAAPAWREVFDRLRAAGPRPPGAARSEQTEPPRPVLMPVLTVATALFTDESRRLYRPRFELPAGEPVAGSLRLINRGVVPAGGRCRIGFTAAEHGTVRGEVPFDFDLPPGAETTLAFTVELRPGVERALLRAELEQGDGFRPVGLFLYAAPVRAS